jgi:hypothetical protein
MIARLLIVASLALVLSVAAGPGTAAQKDEPAAVRQIDLKDLKFGLPKGKVTEPTTIASMEELAKAFPDNPEAVTKIKDQVDFAKSKLVLFAWSGSGGDKLGFQTEKGDKGLEVTFLYQPGLTRDLRGHTHLFAVPRDSTWKVMMAKGK